MFEIQNFAGGGTGSETINGPAWAFFSDAYIGGDERYYGFIPSSKSIEYHTTQGLMPNNDNGTTTIQIVGLSNVSGDSPAASTATLDSGKTIDDVTVTGSDASSLRLTIDGKTYAVSGGKLVEAAAEVVVQTTVINQTKRANGKIVSKSYPFINPAATSEQIATFVNALNELTENTKEKIIRVDKTEIG